MKSSVTSWLRQPTTIHGIAGLVGTLAAVVAELATHDTSLSAAAGVVAGSIVAIAVPDNSAAQASAAQLGRDTVTAVTTRHVAAMIPNIVADALAALSAATASPLAGASPAAVIVAAAPGAAGVGANAAPVPGAKTG